MNNIYEKECRAFLTGTATEKDMELIKELLENQDPTVTEWFEQASTNLSHPFDIDVLTLMDQTDERRIEIRWQTVGLLLLLFLMSLAIFWLIRENQRLANQGRLQVGQVATFDQGQNQSEFESERVNDSTLNQAKLANTNTELERAKAEEARKLSELNRLSEEFDKIMADPSVSADNKLLHLIRNFEDTLSLSQLENLVPRELTDDEYRALLDRFADQHSPIGSSAVQQLDAMIKAGMSNEEIQKRLNPDSKSGVFRSRK